MHLKWLETWVGVYALLKRDIPHLIKAHCVAHRLELAFSNSVKVLPPLDYPETKITRYNLRNKSPAMPAIHTDRFKNTFFNRIVFKYNVAL